MVLTNRSPERATELADQTCGTAVPFEQCLQAMADADLVITSTGSPIPILHGSDLDPLMEQRGHRPLVIVDIAVPRDVDPEVGKIRGVHLHDIDALETTVEANMRHRGDDIALCREIIGTKIERLMKRGRRPAEATGADGEMPAYACNTKITV